MQARMKQSLCRHALVSAKRSDVSKATDTMAESSLLEALAPDVSIFNFDISNPGPDTRLPALAALYVLGGSCSQELSLPGSPSLSICIFSSS